MGRILLQGLYKGLKIFLTTALLAGAIEGCSIAQSLNPGLKTAFSVPPREDITLDADGNLLLEDGSVVEMVFPQRDSGDHCAIQLPVIRGGDVNRAGCPLFFSCDKPVRRDTFMPGASDPILYIRLNFVVIRNGGSATNILQADCDSMVNVLNNDFSPWKIQFCAGPAQFHESASYYNLDYGTEEYGMKYYYSCMPEKKLNVYVVNTISNPSAGGIAKLPFHPYGGTHKYGGIILTKSSTAPSLKVISHEVGHALGLYHTFYGVDEMSPCSNCYERVRNSNGSANASGVPAAIGGPYVDQGDREGDYCSDTHPHTKKSPCSDLPGSKACDSFSWKNTPITNIMSYSCHVGFTSQQAGRMRCMIADFLQSWIVHGGVVCTSGPPVAGFIANPTTWIAPASITFTDKSTPSGNDPDCADPDTINTWMWTFDLNNTGSGSVSPATFSGKNPTAVAYPNPGVYSVRLIVTSPNGSDTFVRNDYVTVLAPLAVNACKELNDHWITPSITGGFFAYEQTAGDYITGCPNSGDYRGFYEKYTLTQPNLTVGSVRVLFGLGLDNGGDTYFKVVLYGDDASNPGKPDKTKVIGSSPGWYLANRLDFPMAAPAWDTMEFCPPANLAANLVFHAGVEFFNAFSNPISDRIVIMTTDGTSNPHGQSAGLNHRVAGGSYDNYLTAGYDFDLGIIPILGPPKTSTILASQSGTVKCDTTFHSYVFIGNGCVASQVSLGFSDGSNFNWSPAPGVMIKTVAHTDSAPTWGKFITTNSCNRNDTVNFTPNYVFNPVPVVDFAVSGPGIFCKDSSVAFTGSPSALSQYKWDFGDGNTSSVGSNSVSHNYSASGIYTVTLQGVDSKPCSSQVTKQDIVQVVDCSMNPPVAGFGIVPNPPCAASTIYFQDSSTGAPDTATNWFWDFGDGTYDYSKNPFKIYGSQGNFTVKLIAGNNGGFDTIVKTISVTPAGSCVMEIGFEIGGWSELNSNFISWIAPGLPACTEFSVERETEYSGFSEAGHIFCLDPGESITYRDDKTVAGVSNFYRVISLAPGREPQQSNTIELNNQGNSLPAFRVWPNPASEPCLIHFEFFAADEGTAIGVVHDALGRRCSELQIPFQPGLNSIPVPFFGNPSGIFQIQLQVSGRQFSEKLILLR